MKEEYTVHFGEPDATHDDDLHIFTWYDREGNPIARIIVDQVGDRGGQLKGEVSVYWLQDETLGTRPIAGPSDVNLLATGANAGIMSVAKEAEFRVADTDWRGALQHSRVETVQSFRDGNVGTRLGQDPDREFGHPFLIKPYIASSGSTVMYGEGGLAKSTLALAFSISVATGVPIFGDAPTTTGPVVYFDYEDDETIHDARMLAICKSLGINVNDVEIWHVPLTAKVNNASASMKRRVREYRAVFYVLDSVGMGRGGDAASAEDTIRLFRALRGLRLPNLAIDHISKAAKKQNDLDVDAFGSTYTMNSARLAWALKRAKGPDHNIIYIAARNTKTNHTKRAEDRGIEIRYQTEDDVPTHIEIVTTDALRLLETKGVSTEDRMVALLIEEEEGYPIQEIADHLGVKRARIDTVLGRDDKGDPTFERRGKGPVRIRLRDWDTLQQWSRPPEDEAGHG